MAKKPKSVKVVRKPPKVSSVVPIVPTIIKLDIGCGKNKRPGFIGVDSIPFDGVDVITDVRITPWQWDNDSVDEIYSSHFVEHLTREEWVPFFNEAYRVLKPDGAMQVITPHWSHDCAYGDPTHKSFLSAWVANYLHKGWRETQGPHTGYICDFDCTPAGSWDPWLEVRSDKMFSMNHYTNSYRDLILNLVKKVR